MTHRVASDGTVEVWNVTQVATDDTPEQGAWVGVPVSIIGGRLQFVVRCVNQSTFESLALFTALMKPVLDENNNLIGLTNTKSSQVSQIGPVVITPAVVDGEVETTPAVIDNRWHVNAMLGPVATRYGAWEQWTLQWVLTGSVLTEEQKNASENGVIRDGIELLDPATILSPVRRW